MSRGGFEVDRLLQVAAHDQSHRHDGDADDEWDAPSPGLHGVGVEQPGQQHSKNSCERRSRALARYLPGAVFAAFSRRCRFQQIGSGRPDFAPESEALDQRAMTTRKGAVSPIVA